MRSKLILLAAISFISTNLHAIEFSVMSYNVENLFDITHDERKTDFTYLPLAVKRSMPDAMEYCRQERIPVYREQCFNLDWNEEVLNVKIQNISRVLKAYDNGNLADILMVQEVENINVLRMLNDRGGLGYRTVVLLEGDDQRGIDVGIMSKFPVVGTPKLHYIDPSRRVKTRGILEVRLQVGSKVVAVFSNHWPSQGNPDELRILAAKKLLEVMPKAKADIRIAAGDFNTTEGDDPHGLNDILTKPKRGLYFVDTNPLTKVIEEMEQPPGTHWYQKKWEYLDRIFVDSRSAGNLDSEFSIHVKPFMMTERIVRERSGRETVHIVPFRFSAEEQSGFADHLPIVTVFKMN